MSFINYSSREINCKIVYYGPGLCGKTTEELNVIFEELISKPKTAAMSPFAEITDDDIDNLFSL